MNQNHYAVIMAGGVGTRFWPVSRSVMPKQFLDILNTGRTLLQGTFDRFENFIPKENIYVVTSAEYRDLVAAQLPELPLANIIGEPERKNTAPCIAYIANYIQKLNPNAKLIVSPSDHVIREVELFKEDCEKGLKFTDKQPFLVTLGIKPTHPNTGFGYIHTNLSSVDQVIKMVNQFVEKPDLKKAIEYVYDGNYFWNAGIFIWNAADILKAIQQHQPEMAALLTSGLEILSAEDEERFLNQFYAACESISIDHAVMEKAQNVAVIPARFDWSDLGTWNSAWEQYHKDEAMNALAGENAMAIDSKGCLVHSSDQKLVLLGGVTDLIVVNTPDAILVCNKESEQQIKDYLSQVKARMGESYL